MNKYAVARNLLKIASELLANSDSTTIGDWTCKHLTSAADAKKASYGTKWSIGTLDMWDAYAAANTSFFLFTNSELGTKLMVSWQKSRTPEVYDSGDNQVRASKIGVDWDEFKSFMATCM